MMHFIVSAMGFASGVLIYQVVKWAIIENYKRDREGK